jgi:uncharacterized membrane protein YccC
MADKDTDKIQSAAGKVAGSAGKAADRTADAARTATEAGTEAAQQGAGKLQEQANTMLDTSGRVSQEVAQRTNENLELLRRLAETMMAGAREASTEVTEWTRQATERQTEAMRQITQARGMDELLETQNRYIRDNLQALLDLSTRVSRLSAEKTSEVSSHLDQGRG